MWIADVTYGGIQRAFLEKVEGEYQGAYFRMTQGLESGITHMLLEDDGSIIVGGLGAGGNWGQEGKLQFGLQKLVPNGTETFDIQKMELADGGRGTAAAATLAASSTTRSAPETHANAIARGLASATSSATGHPRCGRVSESDRETTMTRSGASRCSTV